MTNRPADERGQVLSSFVAVAAVVAIVAGLLVLFGTRGGDSVADDSRPAAKTPTRPASPAAPTSASPTAVVTPGTKPSPTVPSAPASQTPAKERSTVEVFNNTVRQGLADEVASKARAAGWTVAGTDNWRGKVVTSTVYHPAGLQAEAARLAKDLGVDRTKDALPNMKKDRLSVIVTEDYRR